MPAHHIIGILWLAFCAEVLIAVGIGFFLRFGSDCDPAEYANDNLPDADEAYLVDLYGGGLNSIHNGASK